MGGLLYKNLRINFASFLFVLIFTSFCCVTLLLSALLFKREFMIENNGIFIFLGFYYVIFMMPSLTNSFLFEADEGKTAGSFAMSLPRGAKGLVESKYWTILIEHLLVLFLCFLTDTLTYALLGGAFQAASLLMILFCFRILLAAIEIPFLIRFGSEHGVSIKSILVTFLVLLAVIYFLFGDITWLIGTDNIRKALMDWLGDGKMLLPASLFPFFCVAAYVLSCRISTLLYRKGVENHEQ